MELKTAYKMVLEDLMKCPVFIGKYNTNRYSNDFMSGVGTVMQTIAIKASKEDFFAFNETFIKNIQASNRKEVCS